MHRPHPSHPPLPSVPPLRPSGTPPSIPSSLKSPVGCPLRGYLIVRRQMSFFRHLGFIQRKFQGNLAQCCVIFHFCRQMSRYIATFGLFSTGKCHFRCRDIYANPNRPCPMCGAECPAVPVSDVWRVCHASCAVKGGESSRAYYDLRSSIYVGAPSGVLPTRVHVWLYIYR